MLTLRQRNQIVASIFAAHGRQLMRFFVSRLPEASEAKDLAQEVYLRLLRLQRPDFIRSPEAYVFTVAANIVREHALRRSRRPAHITLDDAPVAELPVDDEAFTLADPEDSAGRDDRMRQFEAALQQLSPKARAALIWHRRDGKTYKDIAERLGVSTNMVKKYLSQALAHCRKHMDE